MSPRSWKRKHMSVFHKFYKYILWSSKGICNTKALTTFIEKITFLEIGMHNTTAFSKTWWKKKNHHKKICQILWASFEHLQNTYQDLKTAPLCTLPSALVTSYASFAALCAFIKLEIKWKSHFLTWTSHASGQLHIPIQLFFIWFLGLVLSNSRH